MPSCPRLPRWITPLLIGLSLALPAAADDPAQAELIQRVQGFLYEQADAEEVVIEVHPPSARLSRCESPQPFLARPEAPVSGRVSVGVRCGENGQQVRYLQAEVGIMSEYPVLATDLAPGTPLTEAHLELRRGNLAELPRQAVRDATPLLGQQSRRALRAGSTLQTQLFQAPQLVERGQRVVVHAGGTGFRVTREGEALERGAMGDTIRVRFGQRELITARVTGDGVLAVEL